MDEREKILSLFEGFVRNISSRRLVELVQQNLVRCKIELVIADPSKRDYMDKITHYEYALIFDQQINAYGCDIWTEKFYN